MAADIIQFPIKPKRRPNVGLGASPRAIQVQPGVFQMLTPREQELINNLADFWECLERIKMLKDLE